jgi:hypothetical protein
VAEPKYRAFLSYSHRDSKFGEWLHRQLESWSIPKDLAGRQTPIGPVPKSLHPIFRDRDDLAAASSLKGKIAEALSQSARLIVVCSPNSAKSPYVNEEIRQFKAIAGSDRVLAIIVDGEPGDPSRECFPQALRFAVGPQGQITDQREEPIAADARPHGDGPDLARLKIIAGLLGVSLDEIRKREAIAQRRRMMMLGATAVVMTALAITAGIFGFIAEQRRALAQRNFETALGVADGLAFRLVQNLRDEHGLPLAYVSEVIDAANDAYEKLAAETGETDDMALRRANLLMERANTFEMGKDYAKQAEAAAEALAIMEGLAKKKPGDAEIGMNLAIAHDKAGDAAERNGKLAVARGHFDASRTLLEGVTDVWGQDGLKQRYICNAHIKLGKLAGKEKAQSADAAGNFKKALTACEAWAALDPSDGQRQAGVEHVKGLLAQGPGTAPPP